MKRTFVFFIAGVLAGVLLLSGSAAQAALSPKLQQRIETTGPGGRVPVIVHFVDRVDLKSFVHRSDRAAARAGMVRGLRDQARRSQGTLQGYLRRQGAEPTELWLINALAVQVPPALVATLAAWPGVDAVELDGQVAPPAPVTLAVPTAPTNNIAAIGVEPLWAAGFTGLGVVVASFDSGVDLNHPDLTTRWRGGTNSWFDPYTNSLTPTDVDGHGTATTSLMVGGAASGNTIGVAPDARWIAAKIFPDDDGDADSSKIIESFQWALNPDNDPDTDDAPDVINNSWGFENNLDECITNIVHRDNSENSLPRAIQTVQEFGIHVVFSAGNSGPAEATSVSPANYPGGLAVGSINLTNYAVSSFSARGPGACSGSIYTDLTVDVYPEVVAPGESVFVAYPVHVFRSGYALGDGTSFSAPHVSGALALLRSAVPQLTGEPVAAYRLRLERALLGTSADLGPPGADNSYGRGLIDLSAAYAWLTAPPPPARLLAPANNAVDLTLPVTLSWTQEDDPDGDTLTLTLLIDNQADFSAPVLVFPNLLSAVPGVLPAAAGIFLFGLVRNRRRLLLAGALLTVLSIVFACGGGGGGGTTVVATNSITTSNLSPATTYYWKVRTVDSYGGASESAVWSFTTR